MATIRSKDTRPEMTVRRLAHRLGYRFRLHGRGLPGSPDLVFSSRRKVVFVHGCFWHRHDCPLGRKMPRARPEYWIPKLKRNQSRDRATLDQLATLGWSTLVMWECELHESEEKIATRLCSFLDQR
jgi:DNA mismatch endonuclease, patch repair protein